MNAMKEFQLQRQITRTNNYNDAFAIAFATERNKAEWAAVWHT